LQTNNLAVITARTEPIWILSNVAAFSYLLLNS
jgi:hypothetical protein